MIAKIEKFARAVGDLAMRQAELARYLRGNPQACPPDDAQTIYAIAEEVQKLAAAVAQLRAAAQAAVAASSVLSEHLKALAYRGLGGVDDGDGALKRLDAILDASGHVLDVLAGTSCQPRCRAWDWLINEASKLQAKPGGDTGHYES
jgi:hypothetical protein